MRESTVRRIGYLSIVTALLSTAAVGLGSDAVAASRVAATTPTSLSTFLYTTPVSVTTSTHKKLTFSAHALTSTYDGSTVNTTLSVSMDRSTVEQHNWSFQATAGTLTANATTGKGTLDTGTQLASYGSLNLTIASAGAAKNTTCGANKTTIHPVKVSGKVNFAADPAATNSWGSVDRTVTFKGILSTSTDDNVTGKCTSPDVCPTPGISYFGIPTSGSVGVLGLSEGKTNLLTISRTTELTSPSGADREDLVDTTATVTATHSSSGEKVTVKPKNGAAATGSAYFSQKAAPKKSECKKIVTDSYSKATVTSKSLTGHEQVFGPLKVGSFSQVVSFEIDTKK